MTQVGEIAVEAAHRFASDAVWFCSHRTRKDEQDAQGWASQFNETLRITGEANMFCARAESIEQYLQQFNETVRWIFLFLRFQFCASCVSPPVSTFWSVGPSHLLKENANVVYETWIQTEAYGTPEVHKIFSLLRHMSWWIMNVVYLNDIKRIFFSLVIYSWINNNNNKI